MKKIVLGLLATVTLTLFSCKDKNSETKEAVVEATKGKGYRVSAQGSMVEWTGYKFTDKKGVKGKFKKINVSNAPLAKTPLQAFNGVEFTIPVSSIFSNNAVRDGKLVNLFFGFMESTELLSGNFVTKNGAIFLNLKMNNTTNQIPLTHTISDRHIKLEGNLNILDFGAKKAYNSIHEACKVLHTGADKVSKTWKDVKIEALVFLKDS